MVEEKDIIEVQEFLSKVNQDLNFAMVGYKKLNTEIKKKLSFNQYLNYLLKVSNPNE